MISKKFTVFTPRQHKIYKLSIILQIIIGILFITIAIIALLCYSWTGKFNINYILAFFIGLLGIAGIIDDTYKIIKDKDPIIYRFIYKFFSKEKFIFSPTQIQNELCSWINKKIYNSNGILIYGKEYTGKTTSVFMYLAKYIKQDEIFNKINWIENIIYIDCKNNKEEILQYFDSEAYLKDFENSLIIVDNVEKMGEIFLKNFFELTNSTLITFILLADISEIDKESYNLINVKKVSDNNIIKLRNEDTYQFEKIYSKLQSIDKIILLIMYYMSLSVTLISINDIYKLFKNQYSKKILKKSIKKLSKEGLINPFPFDIEYYLLINQRVIMNKQSIFWNTAENTEAILILIANNNIYPESAWISYIHLPFEKVKEIRKTEKSSLFINALKCGNYSTLLDELQNELAFNPRKETFFSYELGTLLFYNSSQKNAFEKFNYLLKNIDSNEIKSNTMLKIIESTHGDINEHTRENINQYLSILSNIKYYNLFAQYWKLHIDSERGKYNINDYLYLLEKLLELNIDNSKLDIYHEIIKRCYTDIIRVNHILFKRPNNRICNDFINFLTLNYTETQKKYYDFLYLNANTIHYIDLMHKVINGENFENNYNEAKKNYQYAINLGVQHKKSVTACNLKYIDLKLYELDNLDDFNFYEKTINNFMMNAEINKVGVHIAYCKTLIAKLYMVRSLNDEEFLISPFNNEFFAFIKSNLFESKNIYKNYKNEYGIFRIEFLYNLFLMSINPNDILLYIKKIDDILQNHLEYHRESEIIHSIKNMVANKENMHMYIRAIIKIYPIILQ